MKPSFSLREFLKYVALSIIFGSLYFYFGDLSLQMSKNPGTTSAFFIPSGFAVAMMIIFGARYLPVIFLAKFVLGLSTQKPLIMNLVLCMASISEAYVGFAIYRSFKDSIELNFKYHANLVLIFIVALTAPILSAFIGITYLYFLDIVKESSYFSNIFTWYAGDALSIMIFLPAFLSFREVRHMMFDFLAPIIAILITYCFKWPILWPYIFLIYGAILIPAIFGSIMGVYYSLISMALVMNWFLINHIGPFSLGISNENMTSMQFFLLSISVSALALDGFKRTRLIKSTIIPLMSFWFLSGAIYFYYSTQKEDANKNAMTVLRKDFENRLTEKMEFYENVVNGASAFGLGSYVTQAKWQDYANSISIINKQKGVEAFALIFPDELKIKAHSFVSPTRLNNEGRFEDLINLPELIPSFQKSALLRKPILSSAIKYRLGADSPQQLVSFLIGSIIKNNKVSSWIVIPFLIEDFFKSFVETNYKANFLDIDLYDGLNIQKEKRIYFNVIDDGHRSNESHGTPITRFTLAEHAFTIDWNETQRLITSNSSQNSLFFLLGSIFSIVVTGFILNLKLISASANEIAELKTRELKESEEKFKALFENSSDAVILFNQEIIDCNPECLILFNKRSKKELLQTALVDFFAIRDLQSDDNNLFERKMREVQLKQMVKFECFCLRSGIPFFAEIHLHYFSINGKFIYQAVVRDISERKKIEQNLTKSKEMAEDAAMIKTNFLSTMSHEIRTPLNGVIGMINIILEENPRSEIREDLETIKYSANTLLHIVNEVLDYNKIESGKIVFENELFSLKNLSENIFKIHRPMALEKNLQLLLDYDDKIPEMVIGDEYRNTQILNNFLSNALKFTEFGEVKLSLRLKQKKEESCIIEIKISDTGIGIDMNNQREIFKGFTQAENHHTRKYGGTGLGLAITKRLVEIQNGKIDVISNSNQGTSFIYTIEFKLQPEIVKAETSNKNQIFKDSFNHQRVLLVEDNHVNIIVTKKFLEKWGLKVDVAINGLEAVNHARAIKYNLILMDLHMPLMDGLEATKKIREFNIDVPIIGLSADVMTESVSSLQLIGMNDFVTKPFNPTDFFYKLKTYI